MPEGTNSRLDRIEGKLDELTAAMVSLARAEEKLAGLKQDHDRSFERLNKFSAKLDEIERKVDENSHTVRLINKLFWVAIIAAAGAIASNILM